MSHFIHSRWLVIVLVLLWTDPEPRTNDFRSAVHHHLHKDQDVTPPPWLPSNNNILLVFVEKSPDLRTQVFISPSGSCCNSSDLHSAWEASQTPLSPAACGTNSKECLGSPLENSLQSNHVSVPAPKQQTNMIIKLRILRVLLQHLIPFLQEQTDIAVPRLFVVSEFSNPGVSWGLLMPCAGLQLPTSSQIPSMCRPSMRETENIDVNSTRQVPVLPADITIFIHCDFLSVLCSSYLNNCAIPFEPDTSPRHGTLSTINLESTQPVEELPETSQTLTERHFVDHPFWSKLFNFNVCNPFSREKTQHKDLTNINAFALNPFIREVLLPLMIMMYIVFKLLSHSVGAEKTKTYNNSIYLRALTKSFFIKWTWPQIHHNSPAVEAVKSDTDLKGHQSAWWKFSRYDILNSFIFRPWLRKAMSRQYQSCPSHCCSSTSCPCSSCRHYVDSFIANSHRTLQVSPAFLPDPTRNPSLDLAHVGYRLATLGALPPSFPVSRIKAADAGFYFRGHEDEMTCYSCGISHSGWRGEDNPMDVHRQLSPSCQHVQQRDRELAAIASQSRLINGQNTLSNGHVVGNGQSHEARGRDIPEEDSESRPSSIDSITRTAVEGGRILPSNSASKTNNRAETHEQNSSNPLNSHSTSSNLARSGTPSAGSVSAAESRSSSAEVGHNSTVTPSATRNSEGPEARLSSNDRRMSGVPSPTSATFTRTTPVPPSDGSGRRQNEAAAHADSRQLFPSARLELGGAVYPMYQSMTSRRQTFNRWDTSRAPPLDQIVLSGMFYAGYADCVRCFYCGVGLKHWVATDNVWDEHVRWRPECGYLRAIKGDHFIRETQRRLGIESSASSQGQGRPPPPGGGGNSNQQPSSVPGQRQQPSSPNSPSRSTTSNGTTTANTSAATACQAAAAATPCGATSTSSASLSNGRSDRGGDGSQGAEGRGHGPSVVVSNVAGDGDTLAQLQEEHQELSQRQLCRVCRQAPIDTILMPCGHLVLCESCAGSVTSCPLCRDAILATAKVHFAE